MIRSLKHTLRRGLTAPPIARALSRLNRDVAVVFMLHRFNPDGRDGATSEALLRECLRYVRDAGLDILTLGELARALRSGNSHPAVVFTIDDGYHDFHDIAAPVFEEFGARATVFLTTGFLDGKLWQWWDRIEWALTHTECRALDLRIAGSLDRFSWSDPSSAPALAHEIAHLLKAVSNDERLSQMAELFDRLGVVPPLEAPERYRPMSWEQVRTLAARGFEFAPHTVNHPILSRVDDDEAREEIARSTERCTEMLGQRATTFCYPDGTAEAIGDREKQLVAELGFDAAVVALPGYVFLRGERDLYGLRRFSFPAEMEDVVQIVSGLERVKRWLRREQ